MASTPTTTLLGDPAQYYQLLQQGVDVLPPVDLQAPLAYRDWIIHNAAVLPAQRLNKYNDYLQAWYFSYYQTLDTEQRIYQDYKQLIESLLKVFGNDSELQRISDLDLTDSFQLNIAIPYLSRKLKDIAVYYLQKRDDIKHAKIRYNMVGSNGGIQQIINNNILRTFAKGPQSIVLDESTWQQLPQLSAVNASFSIEINELYDENEYLDKSPDVIYDWPQIDDNWIYTTGLYTLASTNPLIFSLKGYLDQHNALFIDQLPVTDFDNGSSSGTLNVYNHSDLSSQLIGTTQYFASGGYTVAQTDDFSIDIQAGTNSFYWPWGEFYLEAVNLYSYEPMLLTSTNFAKDGATAGTTLQNSDVIWVNDGNVLSGAWLRDFSYTDVQATMMAELKRNKATIFKFPFPGFGTTSARQSWTGKQLTNFESRSTQTDALEAQQLYWSETSIVSTSKPLSIHDTALIACGAQSSSKFFDADKIVVRKDTSDGVHDALPNLVFNNTVETAWLYQPLYTQLPIKVGTTLIYWPFFTDEQAAKPAFEIANYAADTVMLSSTDSTISFRGAVASTVPEKADILEMIDCDNVIMRAWLSGCDVKLSLPDQGDSWISGTTQPGLNLNLESGAWTYFVYDAPDRLSIDITQVKSFVGYNHQPDCQYLRATKKSLTKARNGVDDTGCSTWNQCNCKAVYYTPFGHNGVVYNDNHKMADVIMVDTQYPSPPNINTWKGRDGAPFTVSKDFAWFRVEGNPEPDVGWGPGNWKTNTGLPFQLEPGVRYAYYRVPICCDQQGPPLIVSHSYCECGGSKDGTALNCSLCVDPYTFIRTCDCNVDPIDYCCRPVWVGMALVDGEWVSTNARSAMPLIAGQKYRYTHRDSTEYAWAAQGDIFGIKVKAIDFLLTQQLNGWGQDTTTHCSSCIGAYPYWATSQSTGSNALINCHTNVSPSSPAPYLLVTNPAASRIELTSDLYLEYHRANTSTMVWAQPVEITIFEPKVQWCHINIEPTHIDQIITDMHISNCTDCAIAVVNSRGACGCEDIAEVQLNLGCNAHRVIVSATDVPSQIVLNGKTLCSDYTVMSYCAVKGFSTSHELVNTSLPSVFVPQVTGTLVNATQPWNNIANRHFPTVAMFTNTTALSTLDQYGLLNPSSHGTLTYVGQQYTNEIALQGQQFTEIVAMVEPTFWSNSRGLSHSDNNRLVATIANDARWFKTSMFDGMFSGSVMHSDKYQTFVPYQTEQQVRGLHNGFRTNKQSMWDDTEVQSDFHNYQDIELWNSEQPNITGVMTNWATDLYGNQYMLIKPQHALDTFSIHQQRASNTGTLWVRTVTDDIVLGSVGLQQMYTKYLALSSTIYNQLTGGNISQMQLFGNTIMLVLSSHILIDKLDYDFDLQQIIASDDATVFIDFASAKNVGAPSASNVYNNFNYGGHWYDPAHEKLLVLTSSQDSLTALPHINVHSIDTRTHKFSKLYPKTAADVSVWGSANSQLQLQTYPADGSGNPWVLMSGAPTTTVNKDTGQLICHYVVNSHLHATKHLFVTAMWQMSAACDDVTLVSIDVKQSRV